MKQYGVIILDPPWKYRNNGGNGAAENHYPTMDFSELAMLPVTALAAPDSVLLLWATMPLLDAAIYLVSAWEFDYVTAMPWIKVEEIQTGLFDGKPWIRPAFGTGFWLRGAAELVLVGRRGKPPLPATPPVGLLCERMVHSRKPENLYEYAEMFPGPHLEMFARRARPGWDVFGNEVDSTIKLEVA